MSRSEDDRTAAMVLELVKEIARQHNRRVPYNPLESTELYVPEDVRRVICRPRR